MKKRKSSLKIWWGLSRFQGWVEDAVGTTIAFIIGWVIVCHGVLVFLPALLSGALIFWFDGKEVLLFGTITTLLSFAIATPPLILLFIGPRVLEDWGGFFIVYGWVGGAISTLLLAVFGLGYNALSSAWGFDFVTAGLPCRRGRCFGSKHFRFHFRHLLHRPRLQTRSRIPAARLNPFFPCQIPPKRCPLTCKHKVTEGTSN